MKTVVLIGDSIRMGYQETVREQLADWADVWVPEENGRHSRFAREHLDAWALSRPVDVAHINCGLHDIGRQDAWGMANQVPLAEYEVNVRDILTRAKAHCGKVIWASTTPVNEAWHKERKGFERHEADVTLYNETAAKVAGELGIEINDLYAFVMNAGRDELLSEDGVHYTDEGKHTLGVHVAGFIRASA